MNIISKLLLNISPPPNIKIVFKRYLIRW